MFQNELVENFSFLWENRAMSFENMKMRRMMVILEHGMTLEGKPGLESPWQSHGHAEKLLRSLRRVEGDAT